MKPYFYGFIGALSAAVLYFLITTAYQDHQYVKQLVQLAVQQQEAAKAAAK